MTGMVYDTAIMLWRAWQDDYGILPSDCMLLLLVVGPPLSSFFFLHCVERAS